jgi:hypothetical protein
MPSAKRVFPALILGPLKDFETIAVIRIRWRIQNAGVHNFLPEVVVAKGYFDVLSDKVINHYGSIVD